MELGSEKIPDCQGWATGQPCGSCFICHLLAVFGEVKRVLRSDGVLCANLADSYSSGGRNTHGSQSGKQGTNRGSLAPRVDADIEGGALLGIPWRFALAMQANGWLLRSSVCWAKCLSGGTYVYARTQKGDMPMMIKELVRLDPATVQLWNGEKWTQVVAFTQSAVDREARGQHQSQRREAKRTGIDVPASPLLEIEFRSGERVGCTADHRWPTENGVKEARDLRVGDVVEACQLPAPDVVNQPHHLEDEAIGWLVGIFLAEGNFTDKSVRFSLHQKETEIVDRLRCIARDYDSAFTVRNHKKSLACVVEIFGNVISGILQHYVQGESSHSKRLTSRVWRRSNRFLSAVLKGYLEGDGHWRAKERDWRLGFTNNDQLAMNLRCLGARVGALVRLKRTVHTCNGKKHPGWRGRIRWRENDLGNHRPNGEIVAVRNSRARQFWDIAVADEPHLFALASGLLTHNSSPMPESISGWRWERHRVKVGNVPPEEWSANGRKVGAKMHGTGDRAAVHREAIWDPCPGCPRCEPHGGYVLRKGSWRPTRSHEHVFIFAKSDKYWCDGDAVRTPAVKEWNPLTNGPVGRNGLLPGQGGQSHKGLAVPNPLGANLRDVLWTDDGPLFRLRPDLTDEQLRQVAEFLEPYDNDATTDVLRLGPEPCSIALIMQPSPDCPVHAGQPGPIYVDRPPASWKRCTCERTSHFAAFPTTLCRPFLEAFCPARCCAECGTGWVRVVEREPAPFVEPSACDRYGTGEHGVHRKIGSKYQKWLEENPLQTLGWRPACNCNSQAEPVPGVALDVFAGTCTLPLVARRMGLRAIGIELSEAYATLGRERLKRDLPLFG